MESTEGQSSLPVWDREGMLERIGGDTDIAMAVVEGFLVTIPDQVTVLKDFLEEGNLNGITHTAHSLKGVAATVGGERLRQVALLIERAGKDGDTETAQNAFTALKQEFDTLFDVINQSDLNPENG